MVTIKKLVIVLIGVTLIGSCSTKEVSSDNSVSFKNCPLRVLDDIAPKSTIAASTPKLFERSRLVVIISDLHLGFGKDPQSEQWHTEEDFRWAAEFEAFLKEINRRGGGATDLILNGDTFEIWQSLSNDCSYKNKNLGCTESEALGRFRKVLSAHSRELIALGKFANSGNNRIILTPGNHDSAILFPEVKKILLLAIPAAEGRINIATEGYWLSKDQLIYVEHGHQIGRQVNCFSEWPAPFINEGGQQYLQRPWGEQFVQQYYNDYERRYPIIDNISSEQEGVRYGLAAEGPTGSAKGVSDFFKFLLFDVSWEQIKDFLGEKGEAPQWDVKRIREEIGDLFLVESLPKDDPFREAALIALKKNKLKLNLSDLSDDEIVTLCDKRAALKKMGKDIEECPRKDGKLGATVENLLRSRNVVFGEHLENTYKLLNLSKKAKTRFDVFIYGHTHRADPGFRPLKGAWNPIVVNAGAWQRVVGPEQLELIRNKEGLSKQDVLLKLKLEQLPPCYTLVMIEPYQKEPAPKLWYWRQDKNGRWILSEYYSWSP